MSQLVIPLLTFVAVITLGAAGLRAYVVMKDPLRARLRKLQGGRERPTSPHSLEDAISRVGSAVTKGETSSKLRKELAMAGFQNPNDVTIYLGSKMLLLVIGVVSMGITVALSGAPFLQGVLLMMIGAGIPFFLPNIFVFVCRQNRYGDIKNALPDAIDLLEICVSGGMGLDMAWNSVAEDFRDISVPLADEMALTNLEMHLGETRGEAMRHMAERTGAEEISSLVAVLVQTERFGTSVAEALRIFATNMRELRSQRAEESAEKMAIKLLFPLVVFIFPVVLIVAIGPAGIILADVLG